MTYRFAFVKWLGSASLVMAFAGCPSDDEDDTGAETNPLPTTGGGNDSTTAAAEDSTGTTAVATSAASGDSTTASPDSSGGVTCDPPCEAGQECVGGTCFDMPSDSSTGMEPPPPTNSDYGPCDSCAAGELPVMVGMIPGCFCSPSCDGQGSMCATPNEGTAMPVCALELEMGAGPSQCVLVCQEAADCPPGANCEDTGMGASICTHPA